MDYRKLLEEENESVRERFGLAMERIGSIGGDETVEEPFASYFKETAAFLLMIGDLYGLAESGRYRGQSISELKRWNERLYEDILPDHYEISYANPAFGVKKLGKAIGPILAYLAAELRGEILFAVESRLTEITILNELFIQIYNLFEEGTPKPECIQELIYCFHSDYAELTVAYRTREMLDPELSFLADIVSDSSREDPRYLYYYGDYISQDDWELAEFINQLPQETIDRMADVYTEGYRKGFQVMGRDLGKKKTVAILFEPGFERMVKKAMENFKAMGLRPVIYRRAVWSVNRNPDKKRGFHASSPNRQYDYDHRYDSALYLKKGFTDRKLAALRSAYETWKKEAGDYGGPAVIETFGEEGFRPVNKPEAWAFSEKQEKLSIACTRQAAQIANEYVPGEEISFTIIAFPRPSIGADFRKIFEETVKINTLDYEVYKQIQQAIIDKLDRAREVVITGKGDNRTHLRVRLHTLNHPERETNFENCVADVNIPLGEVFTSPVLEGTAGTLQVGSVYIGDFQFKNLTMEFRDGRVASYSCDNFEDRQAGAALIRQVILKNHDTLPMGEFAIGTNTAAYAMARTYGIVDRLPILIAEKMGPHFAVGDTCYSWAEDRAIYNPDGKEIIARDNEISILRKEEISKAYFNCHTDITLPYRELDEIYGVTAEGEKLPVIADGRFVAAGTETLNEALDRI